MPAHLVQVVMDAADPARLVRVLARRVGARVESMSNFTPSRHPVTVTHLPLVRCAVCRRPEVIGND